MAKTRILFVDDQVDVLEGLRRMLFEMEDRWDMAFAQSGEDALTMMEEAPFDVVVSDIRMPGMDGAELLSQVKARYPQTVRFVLSGQVDDETALRSLDIAHQFLAKPCSPELVQELILSALSQRQLLKSDSLKRLLATMDALPSLPSVYNELLEELRTSEPSVRRIGRIIGKDVAMSAKVLHLVNSAFFGLRNRVTDMTQAVSLLGIETVKSLVLMINVFAEYQDRCFPPPFSVDEVSNHCLAVGALAQTITRCETSDKNAIQDACTAGLLHDLGKLVLVANLPRKYAGVLNAIHAGETNVVDAERAVFGATHAEVGGYLLGLWGLPDSIVQAVAYHHVPSESMAEGFNSLAAVHVANVVENELDSGERRPGATGLDEAFLERIGVSERVEHWRNRCRGILTEAADAQ